MRFKRNSYSYLLLCIIFTISCNQNESKFASEIQKTPHFEINQEAPWREINISDAIDLNLKEYASIFHEKRYICLDDKYLIANIDKLAFYKDRIYILDATIKDRIFIFDLSGNLIKMIDNQGRGPREYVGLSDIYIDTAKSELLANERLGTGIIHYTLNGDYIAKTNSFPCTQFALFGERQINRMYFGQSFDRDVNFEIILTNKDSVLRSGFPLNNLQKSIGVSRSSFTRTASGGLQFTPIGSDTVYQFLSDTSYRIKYVIKQKKSLWKHSREQISRDKLHKLYTNESYTSFGGAIYETTKYISFMINEGSVEYDAIVKRVYLLDKAKNILYRLNPKDEIGRMESAYLVEVPPLPSTTFDDYFVGQWDVALVNVIKSSTTQKIPIKIRNKSLDSIIQKYPTNGNPIICLFK